jgi:hypothetical protein
MSKFGNEVNLSLVTPDLVPPVLGAPVQNGQAADVPVTLPTEDESGVPLAAMKQVELFYKTTSMVGSNPDAERTAGTPSVIVSVDPSQAGQKIMVTVPGLAYGVEYFFDADVN